MPLPRGPLLYRNGEISAYRTSPVDGEVAELWCLDDEEAKNPIAVSRFRDEPDFLRMHRSTCLGRVVEVPNTESEFVVVAPPWVMVRPLANVGKAAPLPIALVVTFVRDLARGLSELPADIRLPSLAPHGLAITTAGTPRLVDAMISRWGRPDTPLVRDQLLYMSPEQVRGLPLDRRSPVFALGHIAYELLCGRYWFNAETNFDLVKMIRDAPPPALTRLVPSHLGELITRMMTKRPEDRFDMPDVVAFIERWLPAELWTGDHVFDELRRLLPAEIEAAIVYGY